MDKKQSKKVCTWAFLTLASWNKHSAFLDSNLQWSTEEASKVQDSRQTSLQTPQKVRDKDCLKDQYQQLRIRSYRKNRCKETTLCIWTPGMPYDIA